MAAFQPPARIDDCRHRNKNGAPAPRLHDGLPSLLDDADDGVGNLIGVAAGGNLAVQEGTRLHQMLCRTCVRIICACVLALRVSNQVAGDRCQVELSSAATMRSDNAHNSFAWQVGRSKEDKIIELQDCK